MSLWLFAALVSTGQPAPAGGHPLAPSIPLLTREQEKRIDGIIDRFILFDTGQLKGPEGRQAYYDFQRLGPEAIFQLIEAFNRTAEMQHSCPVVLIGKRIASLLSASKDVHLLTFAKENLGAGVQARRHLGVVRDLKFHAQLRRTVVQRELALAGRSQPTPVGPRPSPVDRSAASGSVEDLLEAVERGGPERPSLVAELSRRDSPKVVPALVRFIGGTDPALAAQAENLLAERLGRQGGQALAGWSRDPRPEVRAAAAAAAGKQVRPEGEILLRLVQDGDRSVQQAARRALVRLSGGTDFGPGVAATPEQSRQAAAAWRNWWMSRRP